MTYKRKRQHRGDTHQARRHRVKNRTRDLDLICDDLKDEKAPQLLKQEVDFDKPGCGQHYCLHCARYFSDLRSLTEHYRSKPHKRRVKKLSVEPYTEKEAEQAAGQGSFHKPQKRKRGDIEEGLKDEQANAKVPKLMETNSD